MKETSVDEIQNNTEIPETEQVAQVTQNPYLTRKFELFCAWKILPPMFVGEIAEDLKKKFFLNDEEVIALASIDTMKQFAETFGVNKDTLTRWNKAYLDSDVIGYARKFSKKVTNSVMGATYRSAMQKDPRAHNDRKLMLNLAGYTEEQNVNVKGEGLFDFLKRSLKIE